MMNIPDEVNQLIHKYIDKYDKRPRPFNYDEWNSFEQYKEYLEKEINYEKR